MAPRTASRLQATRKRTMNNKEASFESPESYRQSEERFRLLVDSVRDYAIFMLDPKGQIGRAHV